MKPIFSIIIPNYNHAPFLRQRIESVLNQSYQNFEVILLDDCSTDNSWEILQSYSTHEKVNHCLRNERNSGSPFIQWQKGIELAKGEWIWIAESDDWAEPDFLMALLKASEPDDVLVFCLSNMVNEANINMGEFHWAKNIDPLKWSSNFNCKGIFEISRTFIYKNAIPNASAVIFKKPKQFPTKILQMKYCGDWYFWISLLQNGSISYLSNPLNNFRFHGNSTRAKKSIEKEIIRFREYFEAISFAKHTAVINSITPIIEKRFYDWIIEELLTKVKRIGRISRLALLPPLPLWLIFRYYKAYLKMLFNE